MPFGQVKVYFTTAALACSKATLSQRKTKIGYLVVLVVFRILEATQAHSFREITSIASSAPGLYRGAQVEGLSYPGTNSAVAAEADRDIS